MQTVLLLFHILVALGLSVLILIQTSKGGLGVAFGGESFYRTKRGAERLVQYATIAFAAVFLITSIINVILS